LIIRDIKIGKVATLFISGGCFAYWCWRLAGKNCKNKIMKPFTQEPCLKRKKGVLKCCQLDEGFVTK
jgi:hypothetical protein